MFQKSSSEPISQMVLGWCASRNQASTAAIAIKASALRTKGIAGSVVVRPAAQFLGGGALRFRREPAEFGAERGPASPARFRYDLCASDEVIQSGTSLDSIGLLCTVHAGCDDQHAVPRGAIAGQREEALPYVRGQRAGLESIEAQFDGGGDFVDVLATRAGGANKGHCQLGIWNEYGQGLPPE